MTDAAMPPDGERLPSPVVDLSIDGVFHLPPSRDAKRETITITTLIAALLLHLLVVAVLLAEWRSVSRPSARPMQVTLLREAPKPPPPPVKKEEPPKPKAEPPKPKPEPEKPKPVEQPKPPPPPPELKPRESGADEKTEAAKSDKQLNALPKPAPIQPQAEEVKPPPDPLPVVPEPKPTPPRAKVKESAAGKGIVVPLEALPSALQPHRQTAPPIRNLVLRLPGPGGGSAERDSAGDAYLNRLMHLLESNRIYPPAEAFADVRQRVTVYSVLIEPSGAIVNITRYAGTDVPVIDEAARQMIANTEPFPHVPPDYPQIRTLITIMIPMFPSK